MILNEYNGVTFEQSDKIDRWGLPVYAVRNGTNVKVFKNGENAYADAQRYFFDLAFRP